MLPVKRLIQVATLILVTTSGMLLGLSLASPQVVLIAVGGALMGYLCCDFFGWFRIDGLLANLTSIIILIISMKNFFPEDSAGKLVAVANLLVYLQTMLMFQEKTPRLIWQVLVLSLLQVVVAAIFSLNFEGGLLFLFYFVIAGITMALQSIHLGNSELLRQNQNSARRMLGNPSRSLATKSTRGNTLPERVATASHFGSQTTPVISMPALIQDIAPTHWLSSRPLFSQLLLWLVITWCFSAIMFYMVPRHTRPWFGAGQVVATSTGMTKAVDLTNRGKIEQSNQLIFRAGFRHDNKTRDPIRLTEPPYFRGLALSSLIVEGGKSSWHAPHDRVHTEVFQQIPEPTNSDRQITQTITLEPTNDPLIYSAMPAFASLSSRSNVEFCHEISALSRARTNVNIDWAPYQYELTTYVNSQGATCQSWPYISNTAQYRQSPMSEDVPESQWLTHYRPENYPALINVASIIAENARENNPNLRRIELIQAYEDFFLTPGRFRYTLDFRDVRWNDQLDPIEDFVRNHRSGHCELFASALTIMLRSQGIPARLVVGFHGGDFNNLNHCWMVKGKHAHAWVEAYLRPEDCTSDMIKNGEAGPGGAWLITDPTPPINDGDRTGVTTETIELARTMWQDYVLGIDGESGVSGSLSMPSPMIELLQNIDVESWNRNLKVLQDSKTFKRAPYFFALIFLLLFLTPWLNHLLVPKSSSSKTAKAGLIRRWVAGAISLIAPGLSAWVLTGRHPHPATRFYDRLTEILAQHGFERGEHQTHREFARSVASSVAAHPAGAMIASSVWEITEIFQQIRFGKQTIPADLQQEIENSLNELSSVL